MTDALWFLAGVLAGVIACPLAILAVLWFLGIPLHDLE
jgi:hypothetical protein